jgi:SEC-C motif-containing protein
MAHAVDCPCGSGQPYEQCCGLYHHGAAAPTAAALMRSRYAAFVLGKADYLRASWHPSTRPEELTLEPEVRWLGLEVRRCERGGAGDGEGRVEFVARYKVNGRAGRLHEVSRFLREDGRWYYVEGVLQEGRARR